MKVNRRKTKLTHVINVVLFIFVFSATAISAQETRRDAAVIKYAKKVMVSNIETGMPKVRFDRWLRTIIGRKMPTTWEVNDCGEQTGTPADRGRDFPMCVEARSESFDVYISVSLQVGTFKRGILKAPPRLRGLSVHIEGEGRFDVKRLADLGMKLRDLGVDTR